MYLRKRKDRWYYTIEERDELGKRHRHEHFGGFTRAEAARAYRRAMIEKDRTGRYFEPSSTLFSEYLTEWLKSDQVTSLKPNTVDSYDSIVRNHLVPALGQLKLRDLTTPILQDYLVSLKEKYAKSTVNSIYSVLSLSLRWAVANRRYLLTNPMDNVRMPRYEHRPQPKKIFTSEQIQTIFDRFPRGTPLHMPLMLSYCTGMRLGECLALCWSSVDLEKKELQVLGTSYDKNGLPKVTSPKTASSIRIITFGDKLYAELKAQQLWQMENRFRYGKFYLAEKDFVCTKENGRQLLSNNTHYFNEWCKQTFGGLSFHSLRHTHASMLLEHGLPLDYVSKRLGHSSIYTTANIYDTITDKREKEAVKVMDSFL